MTKLTEIELITNLNGLCFFMFYICQKNFFAYFSNIYLYKIAYFSDIYLYKIAYFCDIRLFSIEKAHNLMCELSSALSAIYKIILLF